MTPNTLINLALKMTGVLGVGQTASAEDTNDSFSVLNMMLAQWQRKRWLIWHLVDVSCASTGAVSYTIGTGANFNVARPDRIESGFFRQTITAAPNQVDYPMTLISSREEYNRIALKQLSTFPEYCFYDSAYPTGTLYFWPVPQASQFEMHLSLKEQLTQFTSLSQTINLPAEYQEAIMYNLAGRLRPMYQLPPDPTITSLAVASLDVVRGANAQIPTLTMPDDMTLGKPGYNIYSDRGY